MICVSWQPSSSLVLLWRFGFLSSISGSLIFLEKYKIVGCKVDIFSKALRMPKKTSKIFELQKQIKSIEVSLFRFFLYKYENVD